MITLQRSFARFVDGKRSGWEKLDRALPGWAAPHQNGGPMNKSRLLWMLVAADVLLAFASVGAEMFFGWTLPPALAEYTRLRVSRLPSPGDVFQLVLLAVCVTSAFAAWIGLVSYWWVARRLYLFSLATWMLLILLSGPSVMPSVAAVIMVMNALVGGIILGLVYFSDLAPRFERGSVERAATAGINAGAHRA